MDEDVIEVGQHDPLAPTAPCADERTLVLQNGDTFAVFDRHGDVPPLGSGERGVFHRGTRHLSRLEVWIGGVRPVLLSSTVNEANDALTVDLTNPAFVEGGVAVPRGVLHVARCKLLWQGVCHERLHLTNYGTTPLSVSVTVRFDADFVDIFEVRGHTRAARGRLRPPHVDATACGLSYVGLDGAARTTTLAFSPTPARLTAADARFDVALPPHGSRALHVAVGCQEASVGPDLPAAYDAARAALAQAFARRRRARFASAHEPLDAWVERSDTDLQMMITETPHGLYPYAGVPWYSTVFGRDGIITALQLLTVQPDVARGVLAHLAALQATAVEPARDAEPGKILHEARAGEMAALGEVPFGRYYGSVDATPLFVVLAAAYHRRTADAAFVRRLWPAVERALTWIDTHGDPDGDGFVEYHRRSADGLVQQGWKDSNDSVFHADGRLAEPPIALAEVQAYVYAARTGAAELAAALGDERRAQALRASAEDLRRRFEAAFWSEALGTYALALDGAKRPCLVRSSNAGHCLWAGIAAPERARSTARVLLGAEMFSGWGIRTLGTSEVRYNPMSYHNGSVWPHDNALCAAGFARYGLRDEAVTVLDAIFHAAASLDLRRLPELFCGFDRRAGEGPTGYPVACLPQAWASGAVFMLLDACLGLVVDAPAAEVRFVDPALPAWLPALRLEGLAVAGGALDLLVERHPHDVGVTVLRREAPVRVTVRK